MITAVAELSPAQWQRLNRLLEEALDLDAGQRDAWLSGSGELAPILRQLLDAGAGAGLETIPARFPGIGSLLAESPPVDGAGDEIGPYRLLRLLGQGGMADVWLAERADRSMQRQVALKIPRTEWADRGLNERMSRECAAVERLNHPGIAQLYDAGWTQTGRPFLAFEAIEGLRIDQACAQFGLGITERVRLFIEMLRAVSYAHARLVIHRDLKPSNVLVTAEGNVKLLDFGIAKVLTTDLHTADATELTRIGGRPLTLAYAAPEQVRDTPVTTATDIYALGVMLYELLSGQHPAGAARDSRAALEQQIVERDPPPPSECLQDRATVRALRGDLDTIVLKALHKDPERRFESAASFADDLERHLEGNPVQARRAGRWYLACRFISRNRLPVGAAAATALALVVGLGLALWQARVADAERDHALAAVEHREAVDQFLAELLKEAGQTGRAVSTIELIDRADKLSAQEISDSPEARAVVLKIIGDVEVEIEGVQKALPRFDLAQKLLIGSQDTVLRANVACSRALLRGVSGFVDEARRAIDEVTTDATLPDYYAVECLGNRANLEIILRNNSEAIAVVKKALRRWSTETHPSPTQRLELLNYLALAQRRGGLAIQADASYAAILEELQHLGRDRGFLGRQVRVDRIEAAVATGDLRFALSLIDAALVMETEDPHDQSSPMALRYERAVVLDSLGSSKEALAELMTIADAAKASGPDFYPRALLKQAQVLSETGQVPAAEGAYRRALDAASSTGTATGPFEITRQLTRARLDFDQRNAPAAKHSLDALLLLPNLAPETRAAAQRLRAEAELADGDADAALIDARAAVATNEKLRGDKAYSVWLGESEAVLGRVLRSVGDAKGARTSLEAALQQIEHAGGLAHPAVKAIRSILQDPFAATTDPADRTIDAPTQVIAAP